MANANKSPYEIRLNALELAQRTLSAKYNAECAEEQLKNGGKDIVPTKAPSVEDIIVAATKFNDFISKDSHRN